MTDTSFWTSPADRVVHGGTGRCDITIVQPPFTVAAHTLPAHDPAVAREFAEEMSSVYEVLGEVGTRPADRTPRPATRDDLDLVQVGAWGPVLGIGDPALADNGNNAPLLYEVYRLREQYPDALIAGRVEVDFGESHTEDVVWLPDGTMFQATGWPGIGPCELTGDPHAVAAALGITRDRLEAVGVGPDAEPAEVKWSALVGLALGEADPWPWTHLETSVLKVRHTASSVRRMEELYFPGG
ncbi:DUF6333 family protein [Kitasatospora sp. NPDC004240]